MDGYYSSIAPGYDALHGEEQDRKLAEFLARVDLPRNAVVLDVGCGTGRSARLLPDAVWHGIEPSEGLIAHADPSVRHLVLHGKGESLPFGEASFDVVLSLTALQNYDDPARGLQEMLRVCKPGGLILLSFLRKSSKATELDDLVRATLPVIDAWEQEKDLMFVCRRDA